MDAISQTTFSSAFSWIFLKISLKFVPKGPINNIPALVQINGLTLSRLQAIIWTNDG